MLWSLGRETRSIVISILEANGIPFRPDRIDPASIDRVLFELFGMGSDAMMIEAHRRLDKKMVRGFDDSQIASAVDKIRKCIEVKNTSQR